MFDLTRLIDRTNKNEMELMADSSLFQKVYFSSRKAISRIVSRIVPPDEIEDIVQETYVRLCQVEQTDEIISPRSFMFKTAKNLALDHQKQAANRLVDNIDDFQLFEQKRLGQGQDEMFQSKVSNDEFSHFCEAVRQLPVQCRKVFVLKKVYGYSQREIARELKISESTVEKHIASGMKKCTLFMRKLNQDDSGVNSKATGASVKSQSRINQGGAK